MEFTLKYLSKSTQVTDKYNRKKQTAGRLEEKEKQLRKGKEISGHRYSTPHFGRNIEKVGRRWGIGPLGSLHQINIYYIHYVAHFISLINSGPIKNRMLPYATKIVVAKLPENEI
jgi:hypothetical protein